MRIAVHWLFLASFVPLSSPASSIEVAGVEVAERVVQRITPRESAQKAANGRTRP